MSQKYSGDLWNILPYVGLIDQSIECGVITDFKLPPTNTTYLTGSPFSGDNTGKNPNLRLITFWTDNLNGPITMTGPRSGFFSDELNYKISWEIHSRDGVEHKNVKIGFYTSSYINRSLGPDTMLLVLSTCGPALFSANKCNKYKGYFETSGLNSMFVIVDANVDVVMMVSSYSPGELYIPCFKNLFERYEYKSKCDGLMGTQMMIDIDSKQTLLEPAERYVKVAEVMIAYLIEKSVDISTFADIPLLTLMDKVPQGRTVIFIPATGYKSPTMYRPLYDYFSYMKPDYGNNIPGVINGGKPDNFEIVLQPYPDEGQYEVNVKLVFVEPTRNAQMEQFIELGKKTTFGWNGEGGDSGQGKVFFKMDYMDTYTGTLPGFKRPDAFSIKVSTLKQYSKIYIDFLSVTFYKKSI